MRHNLYKYICSVYATNNECVINKIFSFVPLNSLLNVCFSLISNNWDQNSFLWSKICVWEWSREHLLFLMIESNNNFLTQLSILDGKNWERWCVQIEGVVCVKTKITWWEVELWFKNFHKPFSQIQLMFCRNCFEQMLYKRRQMIVFEFHNFIKNFNKTILLTFHNSRSDKSN